MSSVLCEKKGNVALVTINRPEALNALSTQVLKDLDAVFAALEKDTEVYAVVLTGAGEKSFVAGADISEMKDMDVEAAKQYGRFGNDVFFRIENFRSPVIAAINGFALGGGCELAMACDIRIASTKARFAQPETGLGITPGFGGTQRLERLIPVGVAKELIYTCRQIKADEALSLGLVNKIVEPEALLEEAMSMATSIATKAPIAVRNAKRAMNEGLQQDIAGAVNTEIKHFSDCFSSQDQKTAMTAFVNKEKDIKFQNK